MPRRAAALAIAGLLFLAGCGEEEGGPVSAPSFDAVLPSGWMEGDEGDVDNATELASQGAAATLGVEEDQLDLEAEAVWFYSESEGDFTTNINVLAEGIPPGVGEDNYVETSLGTVSELPGIADLEELEPTQVDGEEAESIEYSAAPAGQALKFRAVALVHDGTGFNITATASEDQFDKASEDLDEILASWEWTD